MIKFGNFFPFQKEKNLSQPRIDDMMKTLDDNKKRLMLKQTYRSEADMKVCSLYYLRLRCSVLFDVT